MRLIENTREHDINIQIGDVHVLVPAATQAQGQDEGDQKVNGWAEIDAKDLKACQESPVVAFYFAEGWLLDSGDTVAEEPAEPAKPVVKKKSTEE